jgi:aryl-alcohol dehydrogenase-like predicted oxidoreductase
MLPTIPQQSCDPLQANLNPPERQLVAGRPLSRAADLGVDHIDTAQFYGPDVANELIRAALHPYPPGLALVSKVGARRDAAGRVLRYDRPDQLRRGVEDNLRSHLRHALAVTDLACVQNLLNLADRRAPPVLDECHARGIAFVPFFPARLRPRQPQSGPGQPAGDRYRGPAGLHASSGRPDLAP